MTYTTTTIHSTPVASVTVYTHDDQPVAYEVRYNGRYKRYPTRDQAVAVYDWILEGEE